MSDDDDSEENERVSIVTNFSRVDGENWEGYKLSILSCTKESIKDLSLSEIEDTVEDITREDIQVLISKGQLCCEDWGSFIEEGALKKEIRGKENEYNMEDYYMKDLIGHQFNSACWGKDRRNRDYRAATVQISTTDRDTEEIQYTNIVLYNEHNGYYSHNLKLIKGEKEDVQEI